MVSFDHQSLQRLWAEIWSLKRTDPRVGLAVFQRVATPLGRDSVIETSSSRADREGTQPPYFNANGPKYGH